MENNKFFQNRKCEYFPCHPGADADTFNCLFCYCPLYVLGDQCGGQFCYTETGIKDCSACMIPHDPRNYEKMLGRMDTVLKLAKRRNNTVEKP